MTLDYTEKFFKTRLNEARIQVVDTEEQFVKIIRIYLNSYTSPWKKKRVIKQFNKAIPVAYVFKYEFWRRSGKLL